MKYYITKSNKLQFRRKWWQRILGTKMIEIDPDWIDFFVYSMVRLDDGSYALQSSEQITIDLNVDHYDIEINFNPPFDHKLDHMTLLEIEDITEDQIDTVLTELYYKYRITPEYI